MFGLGKKSKRKKSGKAQKSYKEDDDDDEPDNTEWSEWQWDDEHKREYRNRKVNGQWTWTIRYPVGSDSTPPPGRLLPRNAPVREAQVSQPSDYSAYQGVEVQGEGAGEERGEGKEEEEEEDEENVNYNTFPSSNSPFPSYRGAFQSLPYPSNFSSPPKSQPYPSATTTRPYESKPNSQQPNPSAFPDRGYSRNSGGEPSSPNRNRPLTFSLGQPQAAYEQPSVLPARSELPYRQQLPQALGSNFVIINNPRAFFKVGRVFMTLWSEPRGINFNPRATNSTQLPQEQDSFQKFRWFVVIREGQAFSLCCPIHTYKGRGTLKPNSRSRDHAIVYALGSSPQRMPGEDRCEKGDFPIVIEDVSLRIDPASRLDFARVYTVEHNVKVRKVGRIDRNHLKRLINAFTGTSETNFPENAANAKQLDNYEDDYEDNEEEESYNGYPEPVRYGTSNMGMRSPQIPNMSMNRSGIPNMGINRPEYSSPGMANPRPFNMETNPVGYSYMGMNPGGYSNMGMNYNQPGSFNPRISSPPRSGDRQALSNGFGTNSSEIENDDDAGDEADDRRFSTSSMNTRSRDGQSFSQAERGSRTMQPPRRRDSEMVEDSGDAPLNSQIRRSAPTWDARPSNTNGEPSKSNKDRSRHESKSKRRMR